MLNILSEHFKNKYGFQFCSYALVLPNDLQEAFLSLGDSHNLSHDFLYFALQFYHLIMLTRHNCASLVAQIVKNSPAMWETWVWSLGRSPEEGSGYPLQYSCLKNPMDRGGWGGTVHGVAKRHDWATFTFHFQACLVTKNPKSGDNNEQVRPSLHIYPYQVSCKLSIWF